MKNILIIALSFMSVLLTAPLLAEELQLPSPNPFPVPAPRPPVSSYHTRRANLLVRISNIASVASQKGDFEILQEAQNLETLVVTQSPEYIRPGESESYWLAFLSSGERTCASLERALQYDPAF